MGEILRTLTLIYMILKQNVEKCAIVLQIDSKCVLYGTTDDPISDDFTFSFELDSDGTCNYIMGIAIIFCIIYYAGKLTKI